jgi:hypothetical protein
MKGDCILCLVKGVALRDSHIVPKFSYRRARAKGAGGDPVHIRNGKAFQTSAQITEYLLCADCEQRIGDVETSVSRLLPLNDGDPAPLLDLVGLVTDTSSSGYRQVPLGRIGDGDLGFFALSVFWRASVSSQYTMSLDPVDAEAFRRCSENAVSLRMPRWWRSSMTFHLKAKSICPRRASVRRPRRKLTIRAVTDLSLTGSTSTSRLGRTSGRCSPRAASCERGRCFLRLRRSWLSCSLSLC